MKGSDIVKKNKRVLIGSIIVLMTMLMVTFGCNAITPVVQ
jgi:hypothetical protein